MSDRDGNGFMWFIAGLGMGALVGVLYAPRSGRETREQILKSAEEGRDWANERARDAREQANQWVERGKDVVRAQKEQLGSALDAGRQAYRSATEK
ncbi:MAG: YtxH domain-containing protein [Candidatus Koribacter versatilis]|uniref:YtxH domain-containing protein n=1 Tax=Candidatus Korobacter versatilis TaxID=658062 RepID=A0A932EP12_9BACT|nr:YtxH domain-containing protein [Candidatus Koribacter versatilis]